MNFESYPASSHDCTLKIASYAWQDKDVRYVWKSKDPVSIANPLHITSPYYLSPNSIPPETKHADVKTSTGSIKTSSAQTWPIVVLFTFHFFWIKITVRLKIIHFRDI